MRISRGTTKYEFMKKVISIETMNHNETKVKESIFMLKDSIFTLSVDLANANLHLYIMTVLP